MPQRTGTANVEYNHRKQHVKKPVYFGDMAQIRNRVKSYKIHKIKAISEEDWIVMQNTHEAIIDRETFEKVKGLLVS